MYPTPPHQIATILEESVINLCLGGGGGGGTSCFDITVTVWHWYLKI